MIPKDVAVLVGSLRQDSLNRKMAHALAELAPASLTLEIVEIGDLPFYNEDLDDESSPPAWRAFRQRVTAAEAVLFVTPEYNRSVPGVLKNALDVGSRPFGANAWQGKPGAVVSVSPGAIGGFGANHHLRQSLVFLDVAALPQPEVYVGGAATLFDSAGRLSNDSTRAFLRGFMQAFDRWIAALSGTQSAVQGRPSAPVRQSRAVVGTSLDPSLIRSRVADERTDAAAADSDHRSPGREHASPTPSRMRRRDRPDRTYPLRWGDLSQS